MTLLRTCKRYIVPHICERHIVEGRTVCKRGDTTKVTLWCNCHPAELLPRFPRLFLLFVWQQECKVRADGSYVRCGIEMGMHTTSLVR